MSGTESEAIVVNESVEGEEEEGQAEEGGEGEEEEEEEEEEETGTVTEGDDGRWCSGCRTLQPIDKFQGTDKYVGKSMRTCLSCRNKYEKLAIDKICSDCRIQQPLSEFEGRGKRYEGKEMKTCSSCRSRRWDVSFMSTRASTEGTKSKSLTSEVGGYGRDTRRNNRLAIGEGRKKMLDQMAKQWVDAGKTFTEKNWKEVAESQKLEAAEIPQVKRYFESAINELEKARKKQPASLPPGRKTTNSLLAASSSHTTNPSSQLQSHPPAMSKDSTRTKPQTRGQTEQAAAPPPARRRLTNNSNQTLASITAEFRREPSSTSPVPVASTKGSGSSTRSKNANGAGGSAQTFIKIDDDTASEGAEEPELDLDLARELKKSKVTTSTSTTTGTKSPPHTRAQSKRTTPAPTARSSAGAKKRSTPPPSSSSIDPEDACQPKRLRTQQVEKGREEDEGEDEESNPRADLEAFANSLERLSRLLFAARDNLSRKQVGVLENDIHHDWKVDEMSTFVEGFLRGADALDGRIKD